MLKFRAACSAKIRSSKNASWTATTLERERGITILAKNTAVHYNGMKINIVDTPGHADFGGEVERILKMVNGVLLLVDAAEGPMPQTRFVLQKAHRAGTTGSSSSSTKSTAPTRASTEVGDEVLELLLELDATDEQLDSPVIFCSGRDGTASLFARRSRASDLQPLFDTILTHIDPPEGDAEGPLQMLVSSIDYNDYVGRIAIGRIERGTLPPEAGSCDLRLSQPRRESPQSRIDRLMYQFDGLQPRALRSRRLSATSSAVSGIEDINIGDTDLRRRHARAAALCQDQRADAWR